MDGKGYYYKGYYYYNDPYIPPSVEYCIKIRCKTTVDTISNARMMSHLNFGVNWGRGFVTSPVFFTPMLG